MIKAGIFDVGGVLAYPDTFHDVLSGVIKASHVPSEVMHKHWGKYYIPFKTGKITEKDFWDRLMLEHNVTLSLPDESLFEIEYIKNFRKLPEVFNLITKLRKKDLRLALLSNMIPSHTNFLREIGITEGFEVAIFSNEVGMQKPDKEIYHHTLKALNLKPEEAFFVDDKEKNVEAANALGIHGIKFTTVDQLTVDLIKLDIIPDK